MPPKPTRLFLAFCPDKLARGTLDRRLAVRQRHIDGFLKDKAAGSMEFGQGFLAPPDSPLHATDAVKNGAPALAGSVMHVRAASLADAWARIKADPYWTEGVWDPEATTVAEFGPAPKAK